MGLRQLWAYFFFFLEPDRCPLFEEGVAARCSTLPMLAARAVLRREHHAGLYRPDRLGRRWRGNTGLPHHHRDALHLLRQDLRFILVPHNLRPTADPCTWSRIPAFGPCYTSLWSCSCCPNPLSPLLSCLPASLPAVAYGVIAGMASYILIRLPFWAWDFIVLRLRKQGPDDPSKRSVSAHCRAGPGPFALARPGPSTIPAPALLAQVHRQQPSRTVPRAHPAHCHSSPTLPPAPPSLQGRCLPRPPPPPHVCG